MHETRPQQIQEEEGGHQEYDPYVRAVCFSPDGKSIVAGMEKCSAKILLLREDGGRQGAITLAGHEVGLVFVFFCLVFGLVLAFGWVWSWIWFGLVWFVSLR